MALDHCSRLAQGAGRELPRADRPSPPSSTGPPTISRDWPASQQWRRAAKPRARGRHRATRRRAFGEAPSPGDRLASGRTPVGPQRTDHALGDGPGSGPRIPRPDNEDGLVEQQNLVGAVPSTSSQTPVTKIPAVPATRIGASNRSGRADGPWRGSSCRPPGHAPARGSGSEPSARGIAAGRLVRQRPSSAERASDGGRPDLASDARICSGRDIWSRQSLAVSNHAGHPSKPGLRGTDRFVRSRSPWLMYLQYRVDVRSRIVHPVSKDRRSATEESSDEVASRPAIAVPVPAEERKGGSRPRYA